MGARLPTNSAMKNVNSTAAPPSVVSHKSHLRCAMATIASASVLLSFLPAFSATLTWDASGSNPTAPTDGGGSWSVANANWSDGLTDSVWVNGNNAIFGSGGAGGTV